MEIKIESRFLRDVVVLVPDIFRDARPIRLKVAAPGEFPAKEKSISPGI